MLTQTDWQSVQTWQGGVTVTWPTLKLDFPEQATTRIARLVYMG
jgi:hypothetical protein